MRVGMNPNRKLTAAKWSPIVVSAITYLPNLEGYHARRLEVVQVCLTSMRKHADMEHTFLVWDSGSCQELTDWLVYDFKPDILIQSALNLGKNSARTSIVRMLPPETIVTCSDDDMLFYPGWLSRQVELLRGFPNVSAVTGYPVRTSFRWGNEKTLRWAKKNATVTKGRYLPDVWERDFAVSVGRDAETHIKATETELDTLIEYNGLKAYATSHHCQFIGYTETIASVSGYDGMAMGDERPFDIALDSVGLRLATTERLSRHMGNIIHDELRNEITEMRL